MIKCYQLPPVLTSYASIQLSYIYSDRYLGRKHGSCHYLINRIYLSEHRSELILAAFTATKKSSAKESPVISLGKKDSYSDVFLFSHVLLSLIFLVVNLSERLGSFPVAILCAGKYLSDR